MAQVAGDRPKNRKLRKKFEKAGFGDPDDLLREAKPGGSSRSEDQSLDVREVALLKGAPAPAGGPHSVHQPHYCRVPFFLPSREIRHARAEIPAGPLLQSLEQRREAFRSLKAIAGITLSRRGKKECSKTSAFVLDAQRRFRIEAFGRWDSRSWPWSGTDGRCWRGSRRTNGRPERVSGVEPAARRRL